MMCVSLRILVLHLVDESVFFTEPSGAERSPADSDQIAFSFSENIISDLPFTVKKLPECQRRGGGDYQQSQKYVECHVKAGCPSTIYDAVWRSRCRACIPLRSASSRVSCMRRGASSCCRSRRDGRRTRGRRRRRTWSPCLR